jgi:hypothetical protein
MNTPKPSRSKNFEQLTVSFYRTFLRGVMQKLTVRHNSFKSEIRLNKFLTNLFLFQGYKRRILYEYNGQCRSEQ